MNLLHELPEKNLDPDNLRTRLPQSTQDLINFNKKLKDILIKKRARPHLQESTYVSLVL